MTPETLAIMKVLIENLDDDSLADFALIVAKEVTKRGRIKHRAQGATAYEEMLLKYQQPIGL